MAGKPSKASAEGAAFLKKNPRATIEQVAQTCGLTVSAIQKSPWWKDRPREQKAEAPK